MKENFTVYNYPFAKTDDCVLVANLEYSNEVFNFPCRNYKHYKTSSDIGVWKIKKQNPSP